MKTIITAAVLILFASSCKEGWSEEYKDQYRESCMEEAHAWAASDDQAKAYCDCSLEVIMKHYSTITETVENKDSVAVTQELQHCRESIKK